MKFTENQIYHVFNQGNNRQQVYWEAEHYLFFLRKVRRYITPLADILCYCLMPNHFHFLLVPNDSASLPSAAVKPRPRDQANRNIGVQTNYDHQEKLSQAIGTLLSSYTKAVNKQRGWSGSIFRGRTKVKDEWIEGPITLEGPNRRYFFRDDLDYARQCFYYIHQNPVKAGLVTRAEDWIYGSARDYAGLRAGTLCNQELARELGLTS
jgi:putative transposase